MKNNQDKALEQLIKSHPEFSKMLDQCNSRQQRRKLIRDIKKRIQSRAKSMKDGQAE
jgi:hypothetical protein